MGIKVAQLAFSLSNRAGGIFEILLGQSHALQNLGVGVQALGLEDDLWSKDRGRWGTVPASVFSVQGPRFFGYSQGFSSALEKANPDLCHLHSLWMYPGVAMERWSRKNGRPYMVTPNGMLEPWALRNSGWKKRLAGLFYENAMLRGAACLQANTLKEADDFRAYGLKNRIEVVPNGVEVPEGSFKFSDLSFQNRGKKRLVFLGRIHPKKGLVGALRAWANIQNPKFKIQNSNQWQFVIAGWDQGGHEAELKRLCGELGLKIASVFSHGGTRSMEGQNLKLNSYKLKTSSPEVEAADVVFYGSAFGKEKEALLRSAEAFVLPSFSEGVPMSVLEAWSYGLPVVITPECNLPEGFACGAALEIRNRELATSHSLPATPTKLDSDWEGLWSLVEMSESERGSMGMRGRHLVEEKFTWPKVAVILKEIYESLP
jgi:glycosyltransferase involved in cell wall biosynthesis